MPRKYKLRKSRRKPRNIRNIRNTRKYETESESESDSDVDGGENIFLKFDGKTYSLQLEDNDTINDIIEKIKEKIKQLDSVDPYRFIIGSQKGVLKFEDLDFNTLVENLNYFVDNTTYMVKIGPERKEDSCNKMVKELFEYLYSNLDDNTQVIVSPFSSNVSDVAIKNLIQQFHFRIIQEDKKNIIYVLLDANFFNDNYNEVYNLINCTEKPVKEIKDNNPDKIKKFVLIKPFEKNYPMYAEYYNLFKKLVAPKLKGKNVTFYVMKCIVGEETVRYLKEYDRYFGIYSFGGLPFFDEEGKSMID